MPDGTGAWKLDELRPATGRQVRPQRRLVGRQDAARRASSSSSSTRPARWSPPTRATRSTRSSSSTSCRARPSSTTRTSPSSTRRRTNHRQIWMRTRQGPVRGQAGPPGARPVVRPRRRSSSSCSRARPSSANDQSSGTVYPYFDPSGPAADPGHRQGQAAAGRRRRDRPDGDAPRRPAPARSRTSPSLHPEPGRSRPGSPSTPAGREPRHVLRRPVVPGRAGRPAVLRRRRARHRRLRPPRRRPDVFLNSALKTKGIWNSSQYSLAGVRRRVHRVPDGRRRRRPEGRLRQDRDDPHRGHRRSAIPYFYNYLSGQLEEVHRASTRARSGRCSSRRPQAGLTAAPRSGRRPAAVPVSRPRARTGDVADGPLHLRAAAARRSSRCGCWPRSCSSSPTSCRTTSGGRSWARSRRRRASTRSTSGSARTGRSSSSTSTSMRRRRHPRLRELVRVRPAGRCRSSLAAIGRSAKLAGLALLLTDPDRIAAGLYAARRRDRPADRAIVLLGVTSSSIPEFVTGTFLVVVVGVQLGLAAGPRHAAAGRRTSRPRSATC